MQHLLRNGTKDIPHMTKILVSERVVLCNATFRELIRICVCRWKVSLLVDEGTKILARRQDGACYRRAHRVG